MGVTSDTGNAATDDCAYHAIELIELMGKDIPVVRGASGPVDFRLSAPEVHGPYGRGPLGKPDYAQGHAPATVPLFCCWRDQALWQRPHHRGYGPAGLTRALAYRLTLS